MLFLGLDSLRGNGGAQPLVNGSSSTGTATALDDSSSLKVNRVAPINTSFNGKGHGLTNK